MTDCRECARYTYTVGPSGWLEQCTPNGRSTAFMRADYGVYGEPHCGPEGKLFTSMSGSRPAANVSEGVTGGERPAQTSKAGFA